MKNILLISLALFLIACQEEPKKSDASVDIDSEQEIEVKAEYPEMLQRVFNAHGGMDTWKKMKNLVYEIPKSEYSETHSINLYSRKDRVDTPDYSMGFDGNQVWLLDPDTRYSGDPVFYHNLMFYFYAMPFVLADKGIVYTETEALEFEGKSYPGIGIGYEQNIGTTPKDEYYIHFDPESYQMAWLGYTVTYRTGQKSDTVKWIRYDNWQEIEGVILPSSITWHDFEGRTIKEAKSTVVFENVVLSTTAKDAAFFEKPSDAVIAQPKIPNQ